MLGPGRVSPICAHPLSHPWLLPFSQIPISQETLLASPPKQIPAMTTGHPGTLNLTFTAALPGVNPDINLQMRTLQLRGKGTSEVKVLGSDRVRV